MDYKYALSMQPHQRRQSEIIHNFYLIVKKGDDIYVRKRKTDSHSLLWLSDYKGKQTITDLYRKSTTKETTDSHF